MMISFLLKRLTASLLALGLGAGEAPKLGKLPDWAEAAARESLSEAPPAEAEAWVLLDRREVTYLGSGLLQIHRFRLVKVIKGKGLDEAVFSLTGLKDQSVTLKDLGGWNLRPDGDLVKLGRKDRATFGENRDASFDTSTEAVAALPRVVDGSYVAFESEVEVKNTLGPELFEIMDRHPIRTWELRASMKEGLFGNLSAVRPQVRRADFQPWVAPGETLADGTIRVAKVPPLPVGETYVPSGDPFLPRVEVCFKDPQWPRSQAMISWDAFGGWYHGLFSPHIVPLPPIAGLEIPQGKEGLRSIWRWLAREMVYKQVYLTAARDLEPETSPEVARKRYGDCKDLACLFLAMAQAAGYEGHPVTARINASPIREGAALEEPRFLFNHVIAALKLERSLGFPAEVVTPGGRFLLVDPTDPFTPLGHLSAAHRKARVLLCLPKGGHWVEVPEASIVREDLDITYTGSVSSSGSLTADIRLKETGGCLGLRRASLTLTRQGFRKHLESNVLVTEIDRSLEIASLGDPLDLENPFEVHLKITSPHAITQQGSDWVLKLPVGLPPLPYPLTRPGKKRQFPVERFWNLHTLLQGRIDMAEKAKLILPECQGSTPFRALSWKMGMEPTAAGGCLTFQVDEQEKDAAFPSGQVDQAVGEWKKDRALVRSLLEDGLAMRP